jgi:flagellar basal body-associated protein FliL
MNKSLPWIILGVVVVAGIIAYIVISNRSSSSGGGGDHYTGDFHGSSSGSTGTPSQWLVDLGALANIYQQLYDAGIITK